MNLSHALGYALRLRNWRNLTIAFLAVLVVVLDQYTKHLVRMHLPLNISWNPIPWLDPIMTLTHTRNTGAAFGIFPNLGPFFVFVAMIAIIAIMVYYRQLANGSWLLRFAFGFQLGGATGNLIDRLARGYVTDFIDFRWWPVWNIADASIVVGTVLLGIYMLFLDRPREPKAAGVDRPHADAPDAS